MSQKIENTSNYVTLPVSYKRTNVRPLDTTDVWTSLGEARHYAETPTAYVGQIISVAEEGQTPRAFIVTETEQSDRSFLKELTLPVLTNNQILVGTDKPDIYTTVDIVNSQTSANSTALVTHAAADAKVSAAITTAKSAITKEINTTFDQKIIDSCNTGGKIYNFCVNNINTLSSKVESSFLKKANFPTASSSALGGIKIGFASSNTSTSCKYGVKLSSSKAYVEIPKPVEESLAGMSTTDYLLVKDGEIFSTNGNKLLMRTNDITLTEGIYKVYILFQPAANQYFGKFIVELDEFYFRASTGGIKSYHKIPARHIPAYGPTSNGDYNEYFNTQFVTINLPYAYGTGGEWSFQFYNSNSTTPRDLSYLYGTRHQILFIKQTQKSQTIAKLKKDIFAS
jgi:hypothetical protein